MALVFSMVEFNHGSTQNTTSVHWVSALCGDTIATMVNRVIDRLCQVQGVEHLPVIEIKELLDVSYQAAKKIHDGGGISMATAMRAAQSMPTIEPLWLMTGVGPMHKPDFQVQEPAEQYSVALDAVGLPPAQPSLQPILAWEFPDDLPEGEFVMVPKLDIKLSAGNGHEQLEINLTRSTPLAFRASWVREKRLKPSKLAAMSATGNSMEPGIFDGDSLVVDTSQTEVLDGKVYALWYDGGERVKRLYRLPGGGLRIKSDNPDHPPIEVQPEKLEHVRILGRVVHRSGDGGL